MVLHGRLTAFGDDIWPADRASGRLPRPQQRTVTVDPLARDASPWLEFVEPPQHLAVTDLPLKTWVGEPSRCSSNVTSDEHPWWHPGFRFQEPVHAVRVQLRALHEKGKLLWDVIFAGRPGNDFIVPNAAPPAGGKLPLFPEFCPPLQSKSLYELHIKDLAESPKFDEILKLRPIRSLPRRVHGPAEPRPPSKMAEETAGAVGVVDGGMASEVLSPETVEPDTTLPSFL
uniref:Uncharacterized protein n=1 Tax=Pyrodinium bahamense TaxID=73915 RepID=A0A7S0A714_9DINO|mmetsp:Transcript_25416/g.69887  ORF Transcript_25416/g.69887 Transcript_25416/m.69887 type:complete len:229 (+) Transcript_25416:125-811(+)